MSEEPLPDDTVHSALQKLFPEVPAEDLEPAAAWLGDKFGMTEYADLEGIKPMADAALSVVATDASVGRAAKQVLDTLLRRLAGLPAAFSPPPRGGEPPGSEHVRLAHAWRRPLRR
ncbi:unnamed protein product [Prorocentrum cordatum]|uniref:Uncharacterized protein n=1 Tax=Prorocentrum cordatum TaxID=2364126 RepID=A0ABN9W4Z6_9DINO|nr:unnamed protein product [Polarella glacialis]